MTIELLRSLLGAALLAALLTTAGCTSERLGASQCEFDTDCASGEVCAGNVCRAPCRTDADCRNGARCLPGDRAGSRACVPSHPDAPACVRDSDCPQGRACLDGACRPQCQGDYDCQVVNPLSSCMAGRCVPRCEASRGDCDRQLPNGCEVDLRSDVRHCGACGRACPAGQVCSLGGCRSACAAGETSCGGACVRTDDDPAHCGRCGNACPAGPRGEARCEAGRCALACADAARYADCDRTASNGCEAELPRDPMNCGACGTACPAAPNASASCVERACRLACNAGFGDCDGAASNGCEADTRTSTAHCGACGTACPAPPGASATCAGGVCGFACNEGFADCDRNPANGCEADTRGDRAHCGMCGRACAAGEACSAGACRDGCGAGETNCGGSCVTLATSVAHCGACGRACPAPAGSRATCAAGRCGYECSPGLGDCDGDERNGCETALATSAAHCGACGRACSLPNATAACAAGACAVASCNPGFADCDGSAANGCEVNTGAAVAHCGGCGRACSLPNATAACASGACAVAACNAGFADCDGVASNGCETATATSTAHCGMCGRACSLPNATAACSGGACAVASCNAGFGNCDGNATNGCETDVTTATAHCGACGRACAAGQVCSGGTCMSICLPPTSLCASPTRCVNLQTSVAECGACGNACPARANARPTCTRGACGFTCDAGFGDCDGMAANGCETNTNATVAHCGACGAACAPANAAPACASGACGIAACNAGFGNCDGMASNGCEVNTATTVAHCGGCGRACSLPNATASCAGGACAVASCNAGFANCDGMAANGCEVNTNTTVAHCGGCGRACSLPNATAACSAGACAVASCAAGFGNCDAVASNGCETNTGTTVAHCGACGRACSLPNATAACSGGACAIAACNPGYADCDMNPANGCEADLRASALHCGRCGNACAAGFLCSAGACMRDCGALTNCSGACVDLQTSASNCGACGRACAFPNATAACASGACGIASCNAGFGNCDAMLANGCETDVTTSVSHCGMCGRACSFPNASAACLRGTCFLGACATNFGNCDGVASNGCEADLQTSTAHCGACGTACNAPVNGTVTCAAGRCQQRCNPGYYAVPLGSGILCAPVPPPRPLAPSSFGWATTRRPVFRWAQAGTTDGARLQVCTTASCATPALDVAVTGSTYTPTADLPPGRLFWRLFGRIGTNTGLDPSPTWQVHVTPRTASGVRNAAFGVTPDYNGDGFADFAVGDIFASTPTVRVYYGSASGLSATAGQSLTGASGSGFGEAVSPAGDVNGDGYGDLVVGASGISTAYVYLGGASGLGTRLTLSGATGSGFGVSVAWAGDNNDDGYGDVVVGACAGSCTNGAAYVYPGTSSGVSATLRRTLAPSTATVGFGRFVQGVGEVNNDALDDVVVASAGAVHQFLGTATAPNLTIATAGLEDLDFAWDVNGDGYGDLAVTTQNRLAAVVDSLRVFYGGVNGLGTTPTSVSVNSSASAYVAGLGDTNGDGFADVAWSVVNNGVRVHLGTAAGVSTTPSVTLTPAAGEGDFGWFLWHAGDVNGDGRWDLLFELTNMSPCRRVVRNHRAGASGISTTPSTTIFLALTCIG